MKAINHYVVVEKIKEEQKKIGGLVFTDKTDTDNRYIKAKIVSVSDLLEGLSEGQTVYYDKHAGHGIDIDEKHYFVIKVGDIVLVQ